MVSMDVDSEISENEETTCLKPYHNVRHSNLNLKQFKHSNLIFLKGIELSTNISCSIHVKINVTSDSIPVSINYFHLSAPFQLLVLT